MDNENHAGLLLIAQQEYLRLQPTSANPDSPIWEIALCAARCAAAWDLPEDMQVAARLLPILALCPGEKECLEAKFGPERIRFVEQLIEWRRHLFALENRPVDADLESEFALRLNELLRQMYIEYDDFRFILMLLAFHQSDIEQGVSPFLARLTLKMFVPLVEILNLWKIREEWVEKCVAIDLENLPPVKRRLQQAQYNAIHSMLAKLKNPEDKTAPELGASLHQRSRRQKKRQPDNASILKEKQAAFDDLSQRLEVFSWQEGLFTPTRVMGRGLNNPIKIELREMGPGNLYWRVREGKAAHNALKPRVSPEAILDQLWVRIICDTEDDCYRILGFLHSLGKPVNPRFSDYFDDYIADPQPNGYRAIQTAVIFLKDGDKSGDRKDDILVEARILTREMQRVNLWGVIEIFQRRPRTYYAFDKYRFAWWHPKQQKKMLEYLNVHLKDQPDYPSFSEFLKRHGLNTRSPILYIFTPKGQIRLLEDNATALDFAYHIHSEIGHHAARILVNRKPVSYGHKLHNGDMVQVDYAPDFRGPDFSWLALVSTASAKKKIKAHIANHTDEPLAGRAEIEHALARTIRFYHNQRGYNLSISGHKLNRFLESYAQYLNLTSLEELYAQIQNKQETNLGVARTATRKILPERIINRLISEEFAASLMDVLGNPLHVPYSNITFCDNCLPVPGDAICSTRKAKRNNPDQYQLVVHRQNCRLFDHPAEVGRGPTPTWPLGWVDKSGLSSEMLAEYHILAVDRPRLLEDVLAITYQTPNCVLYYVNATTQPDGNALISFIISNPDPDALASIRSRIDQDVEGMHQVTTHPVSLHHPSIAMAKKVPTRIRTNPFLEVPVDSPATFFGREKEITDIRAWVQGPDGSCMIVHGQGRVGKTSLGMYLANFIYKSHRTVYAMLVDTRRFTSTTAEDFASFLVKTVAVGLKRPVPDRLPDEIPAAWIERSLDTLAGREGFQRLLIVLDEFDVLIDNVTQGRVDPRVLQMFASLIRQGSPVRWLLFINELTYQANRSKATAQVLRRGTSQFLDRLTEDEIYSYICTQLSEASLGVPGMRGCDHDNPLVKRLVGLSNGIPFFIKQIGNHLPVDFNHPDKLRFISDEDIDRSLNRVFLDGNNCFFHFMHGLSEVDRAVLQAVAGCCKDSEWADFDQLGDMMKKSQRRLREKTILKSITWMERISIIEIDQAGEQRQVRIPVKLFAEWLRSPQY